MGFIGPLILALEPALPWIVGILGVGGAAVGVSVLARNEASKWKESSGLNLSNVPIAVLSGSIGAIALVVGGNLQGTGKVISTSVGIAGIGGAVIALFTGSPPTPPPAAGDEKTPLSVPPANVPEKLQPPKLAPGPLARMITLSLVPSQPNTGGTTRQMWSDQNWEFVVRNEGLGPLAFYSGISIYDEGSTLVWKSPPVDPVYGRKLINLAPGQDADVIQKSASVGFVIPRSVSVEVDLYRNRDDATPFMTSETIPIKMNLIG